MDKAIYLSGDLETSLYTNIRYPASALKRGIQGDVVLGFIITKYGEVDSLELINADHEFLAENAMGAFSSLDTIWIPALIYQLPVDKRYQLVFRYRMHYNGMPEDDRDKAREFIDKQKYDKALRVYDKAIEDNPYEHELYQLRAKLYKKMGNTEMAESDYFRSLEIERDVMEVIYINAVAGSSRIEVGGGHPGN